MHEEIEGVLMRKRVIYLVIVMFIMSGCTNNTADTVSINERIDEMQQLNDAKYNELITRVDKIESSIAEIKESINEIEKKVIDDGYEEINGLVNDIDGEKKEKADEYEDVNGLVNDVDEEIDFIETMIWGTKLFVRSEVQLGDRISDMEIVDISGDKNQIIQFRGEAYVVGTFGIIENNPVLVDGVSFYVDKLSDYLPRERNDVRDLWFMFSNAEEAKQMLSEYNNQGEIAIIIDDYLLDLTESTVVNSARLVRVISKK